LGFSREKAASADAAFFADANLSPAEDCESLAAYRGKLPQALKRAPINAKRHD
jgi:hypothetical protein